MVINSSVPVAKKRNIVNRRTEELLKICSEGCYPKKLII